MGVKIKRINNDEFEVLEHKEVPGYRKAFYIVISVAVIYILYIFSHTH